MTVQEAQQNLREAEELARQQRVVDAERQLKEIRVAAKSMKKEVAEIIAEVQEGEALVLRGRSEIQKIDSKLAQLQAPSEDALDDPDDNAEAIAELQERRAQVLQDVRDAERFQARRIRGIQLQQELKQREFVARNLREFIDNKGVFRAAGGIGPVR